MEKNHTLLKVMSYNIHSGKNFYMIPQLNKIIQFLQDQQPHIIGIQEINENNKRGYQVSKLETCLKMNQHFGEHVKIGKGYYGIGTFSSFNIIKRNHLLLPSAKEQRGLLHTVVKVNDKNLNILNTHLGLKNQERMKQLEKIEQYLQSIDTPYILMGDFNTVAPNFNSIEIIDAGKISTKENLGTLMHSTKRIDYIFVSPDIEVIDYQVLHVNMSDHYPILVNIKL
ncbi:endonuclease/exonuclease/phosphatase family protein [Clostridiaceae bacterium 35-E11]